MYDFIVHRFFGILYRLNIVIDASPSPARTTLVFMHGIGSSHKMWRKTQQELRNQHGLNNVNIVSVDLLGFGASPRPTWTKYSVKLQARSLHKTLRPIVAKTRVIFVGHSLGALVAVEYTKLYGKSLDALILCSPPFYRKNSGRLPTRDALLQRAYSEFAKHPERSQQILLMVKNYSMVNEGYDIDESNAQIFIKTLESSIMNQTAYNDAFNINVPTVILSGILDPVVIDANIASLAKHNRHIQHKRIALAAHEINPLYRRELSRTINNIVRVIDENTL